MEWRLAEAKNKFSEVVRRALTEGPQRVSRRDEAVIVLSEDEYRRLCGDRLTFQDHLRNAPTVEDLVIERDPSPMRDIEF